MRHLKPKSLKKTSPDLPLTDSGPPDPGLHLIGNLASYTTSNGDSMEASTSNSTSGLTSIKKEVGRRGRNSQSN